MAAARGRRGWRLAGLVAAAALAAGGFALIRASGPAEPVREVIVRARSMAFYVDGVAGPNPTLTFKPGERVRLELVNEDHGFQHNLVIPDLAVRTATVDVGQREAVTFIAPAAAGRHEYSCEPHAAMMRGTIAIE